jgi:hypothetical protein
VLTGLISQLSTIRNDLVQFPVAFYFVSRSADISIADTIAWLRQLSERADREDVPQDLRFHLLTLCGVLDSFGGVVAATFLNNPALDAGEALRRFSQAPV